MLADTKDNYFENHSQQSLRIYSKLIFLRIAARRCSVKELLPLIPRKTPVTVSPF